uniref:Uncharacterized protein n=1 Tax=Arundo donax TaxID=35708 RepID=A0A0A9GU40_ARUDO
MHALCSRTKTSSKAARIKHYSHFHLAGSMAMLR